MRLMAIEAITTAIKISKIRQVIGFAITLAAAFDP
jgi:hypothetical protein